MTEVTALVPEVITAAVLVLGKYDWLRTAKNNDRLRLIGIATVILALAALAILIFGERL